MAHLTPTLYADAFKKGFNARFILFMGKRLADGRHPVMLQITKGGVSQRFSLGIACTEDQWDGHAMRLKRSVKGASEDNRVLDGIATKVVDILKRLEVHGTLTLDAFKGQYRSPKATSDMLGYVAQLVAEMESVGQQGNANTYKNMARVVNRYTGGKPLPFAELTPSNLDKLERHLRGRGCGNTSISVYMRTLKAVISKAMKAGLMHPDQYPFETKLRPGYTMAHLKSTSRPRALGEADMEKLKRFPFHEAPQLAQSVRLFIFSYYARGMSFADIAHLKRSDVYQGRIHYHRKKTGGEVRSIPVSEVLAEVMDAYRDHDGPYVFPILGAEHNTAKQQTTRIAKCLKRMNRDMKKAAELLGIETKLTSYVARHTYATTLKRKGTSDQLISEALGHKNTNTTRIYLARFGSEVLDATDTML
jgi:integrase